MSRSIFHFLAVVVSIVAVSSMAEAHVRVTPQGRMGAMDSAKFVQNNKNNPSLVPDSPGPCQNFNTRMAAPLQLTPGQQLTFQVQETINHPGRFYVQFSPANDAGFWDPANRLAIVEDPNNRATTPVTVTVPNINCNTCTFRVLQEMDEQPGEFYVHCIDANIGTVQSTPNPPTPPAGGTESTSSVTKVAEKPGFGGCGLIGSNDRGSGGSGGSAAAPQGPSPLAKVLWYLVLLAPLMLALRLRAGALARVAR